MMLRWVLAALAILVGSGLSATAKDDAALRFPTLSDYLGGPNLKNVRLSPDGEHVAATRVEVNQQVLTISDADAADNAVMAIPMGGVAIDWIEWVSTNRILMRTYLNDDAIERDAALKRAFAGGRRTYVPTLLMFELDTRQLKKITPAGNVWFSNSTGAEILDTLPDDEKHVLIMGYKKGGFNLYKLNLNTGWVKEIAEGGKKTVGWATSKEGFPEFRFDSNRRRSYLQIFANVPKSNGKTHWRKVRKVKLNREGGNLTAPEFEVLYPGEDAGFYYVAARPEGASETAIYLYDIRNDTFVEKVSPESSFDIQQAIFNVDERKLDGVSYYTDGLQVVMSSAELQADVDSVRHELGVDLNVQPLERSKTGQKWLFFVSGPTNSGAYYLFDRESRALELFGNRRDGLAESMTSEVEVVRFETRDGVELTGYLTRPFNTSPGRIPPLVMMPHGGPESRDVFGFDFDAQLLASAGYQVFQPNFRGSSGYGKSFADKGRREWGRKMQEDIVDAHNYLVSQGIAEDGRACIFGYSYGGYAALAAATLTPEEYQCIIAGAGPSDLIKMLDWERREEGSKSFAYNYWVAHIGDPDVDERELIAVSPARQAERVLRPVLILHGADDDIVPVQQSRIMEKALRRAGKSVTYIELKDSSHSYMPLEDERLYYTEILTFLNEHLPVN